MKGVISKLKMFTETTQLVSEISTLQAKATKEQGPVKVEMKAQEKHQSRTWAKQKVGEELEHFVGELFHQQANQQLRFQMTMGSKLGFTLCLELDLMRPYSSNLNQVWEKLY